MFEKLRCLSVKNLGCGPLIYTFISNAHTHSLSLSLSHTKFYPTIDIFLSILPFIFLVLFSHPTNQTNIGAESDGHVLIEHINPRDSVVPSFAAFLRSLRNLRNLKLDDIATQTLAEGCHTETGVQWPPRLCLLTLTAPISDTAIPDAGALWSTLTSSCAELKKITLVTPAGSTASTFQRILPQSLDRAQWNELMLSLAGPLPDLPDSALRAITQNVKCVSMTVGKETNQPTHWFRDTWSNIENVADCASRLRLHLHNPGVFTSTVDRRCNHFRNKV